MNFDIVIDMDYAETQFLGDINKYTDFYRQVIKFDIENSITKTKKNQLIK